MTAIAFDLLVIGSGPAGQKAAIQGAKAGCRVLLIEQEAEVGGACVHRGTIPSKTLRETALSLDAFRRRSGGVFPVSISDDLRVDSLMVRLDQVVRGHERFIAQQLHRNDVRVWQGRARFVSPVEVEVRAPDGTRRSATATNIVIATGSSPRNPAEIPVDHETVLDSDSILSMTYLPASLAVLGAGVIGSEYASIFSALGVAVTLIDPAPRPVAFLEPELIEVFVGAFTRAGGRFLGGRKITSVEAGVGHAVTRLDDGTAVETEKVLFALGRVANLAGLDIERAGLRASSRGLLEADADGRTAVPHIWAVGDVVGPPSLAATAMEQGRRAVCRALDRPTRHAGANVPIGVYTIPEMAQVGMTEAQAIAAHGSAPVGRARFSELARGQIAALEDGLLKIVASPSGDRLLGVQIVGEGAAELVHVGQMAILGGLAPDAFIDNALNFPTLAEAYRVAALDLANRRGTPA